MKLNYKHHNHLIFKCVEGRILDPTSFSEIDDSVFDDMCHIATISNFSMYTGKYGYLTLEYEVVIKIKK